MEGILTDLEIAAQCWCDPTTSHIEMNPALALVVASAIKKARLEGYEAGLEVAWEP